MIGASVLNSTMYDHCIHRQSPPSRLQNKMCAYQVDDASRVCLLASLLAEEQKTLSSVRGPSSVVVGRIWLLSAKVA